MAPGPGPGATPGGGGEGPVGYTRDGHAPWTAPDGRTMDGTREEGLASKMPALKQQGGHGDSWLDGPEWGSAGRARTPGPGSRATPGGGLEGPGGYTRAQGMCLPPGRRQTDGCRMELEERGLLEGYRP